VNCRFDKSLIPFRVTADSGHSSLRRWNWSRFPSVPGAIKVSLLACAMVDPSVRCSAQSAKATALARHELETMAVPSDPTHCGRISIIVTGASYDTHACVQRIGDTLVYTYHDVNEDRPLVATREIRFTTAQLPIKADSIERSLTGLYGIGRQCGPDPWSRTFVSRYVQWRAGDYTVRMQVDTLSHASPVHSTVTVEVVDGLVSCDNWFGPPLLEERR